MQLFVQLQGKLDSFIVQNIFFLYLELFNFSCCILNMVLFIYTVNSFVLSNFSVTLYHSDLLG